jgi:tripartite-type tricarboxylate transporter receptor subunit TctC
MNRITLLLMLVLLQACSGNNDVGNPDQWPQRPLRVIVPFGPGGLADVTLRLASEELSRQVGQAVVIENRPGAGGVAATSTMLNAPADGHTLIVLTNGTSIAETQFPDLPYDISRDLQPVSSLAWFDLILLTGKDSGIDGMPALLQRAASAPQGLRIGTINPGSTQHLSAELFVRRAGIEAIVIPYRTTPDVLGALLRNEVDLVIEAYTGLKGAIEGGQAVPLAVTGSVRNAALPEVPTVTEAGIADFVVEGWNALYLRSEVPEQIVERLHTAINTVANDPALQQRFIELGVVARANTPIQMDERLQQDILKWRLVMQDAGLAP